jgi:putative FmdB family regulatory protein
MPVYEYRCGTCKYHFELRQKFSDPPADECPKCGEAVHKQVSASAFSLKGSGWFAEGYGTKADGAKSEGDTSVGTEAATGAASAESAQGETAASPTTPASGSSSTETKEPKSAVVEKPASTTEKTKSD